MPKTAGMSFAYFLRRVFRRKLFFWYGNFADWRRKTVPTWGADVACLHGHFGVSRFINDFPDARIMVWLRDPVQRMVSHYHWWRKSHIPGDPLCEALKAGGESLADFVRNPVLFDMYVQNLAPRSLSEIDFVGITEQFDRSVAALSRVLNVKVLGRLESRNQNESRGAEGYAIDADTRAAIEKNNAQDTELYRLAVERFEREAAKLLAKRRWVWPHRWR